MSDTPTPQPEASQAPTPAAEDPVAKAVTMLKMLSADARETVLAKMQPDIAEKIRARLISLPEDRPHSSFTIDVQRRMVREFAERTHARRTQDADDAVDRIDSATAAAGAPTGVGTQTESMESDDPLDRLKTLHPAAIAKAMQGERAEAWSIVLDRLEPNARAALQLYLDAGARDAIEAARIRRDELRTHSPMLASAVEVAIARTVVPRAMREHHQLLSTSPMTLPPHAANA